MERCLTLDGGLQGLDGVQKMFTLSVRALASTASWMSSDRRSAWPTRAAECIDCLTLGETFWKCWRHNNCLTGCKNRQDEATHTCSSTAKMSAVMLRRCWSRLEDWLLRKTVSTCSRHRADISGLQGTLLNHLSD